METRANYVLIGAFVLLAAAGVMLFAVWISRAPFSRDIEVYEVVFEGPVNGLSEGGEVRFNGIKVGEVDRLSLDRDNPNRVVARIKVSAQTPVREDSVAELNFLGVTGVTFIQIRAGSPASPLLERKDPLAPAVIPSERTALDELFEGGQDLLTTSSEALARVNKTLSEENVEALSRILRNLAVLSDRLVADGGLADAAQTAIVSVDKAAVAMEKAAVAVDEAANGFDADAQELSDEARKLFETAAPALADARRALASLNRFAGQAETEIGPGAAGFLRQASVAIMDVRALAARLSALLSELEADTSQLVYPDPRPVE